MDGSAGNVAHCEYSERSCSLQNGRSLVWEVDYREKCEFLEWRSFHGQAYGIAWLEETGQIGLTLVPHERAYLRGCDDRPLLMSAQGVAYRVISSEKRHASLYLRRLQREIARMSESASKERATNLPGVVTTDQLSIALQGVVSQLRRDMRITFQQAMHPTCENMVVTSKMLRASVIANPTLSMRQLLGDPYLYGKSSGELIEVWPCHRPPEGNYAFLPMNETCIREIPVRFAIHEYHQFGYLDPTTKIVQPVGSEVDCSFTKEYHP
ncbi:MAG: hypothetical protein AAF438_20970 [Pseudomonadota bacterium]